MKTFALFAALAATAALAPAQAPSPDATTSVRIGGKVLSIKYSAPSVRGRKIFGPGGLISGDPNYPVWRAGANSATSFHTDADLTIGNLTVPKGDYTIYALVENPDNWQLVVNKADRPVGTDLRCVAGSGARQNDDERSAGAHRSLQNDTDGDWPEIRHTADGVGKAHRFGADHPEVRDRARQYLSNSPPLTKRLDYNVRNGSSALQQESSEQPGGRRRRRGDGGLRRRLFENPVRR